MPVDTGYLHWKVQVQRSERKEKKGPIKIKRLSLLLFHFPYSKGRLYGKKARSNCICKTVERPPCSCNTKLSKNYQINPWNYSTSLGRFSPSFSYSLFNTCRSKFVSEESVQVTSLVHTITLAAKISFSKDL